MNIPEVKAGRRDAAGGTASATAGTDGDDDWLTDIPAPGGGGGKKKGGGGGKKKGKKK